MNAKIVAMALSGALLALSQASAQGVAEGPLAEASLLVGSRHDDGVRDAGLALAIAPGWKTYWRNPGEAGVPPRFDWSRSENLAEVEIGWPVPEVFESFGFQTIGYSGEVVLPLRLVPKDPEEPIRLDLDLELGVCREVCVFEEATLASDIAPADPGAAAARIEAAQAAVTPAGTKAGIVRASCTVSGTGEDRDFSATLEFDRPLGQPHVALEGPGESWFHATRTGTEGQTLRIESTLSLPPEQAWVDRSGLRITVLDGPLAADVQGCGKG